MTAFDKIAQAGRTAIDFSGNVYHYTPPTCTPNLAFNIPVIVGRSITDSSGNVFEYTPPTLTQRSAGQGTGFTSTTFNAADLLNGSLSSDKLSFTGNASVGGVRSLFSTSTGKYYFEYTVSPWVGTNSCCGLGNATTDFSSSPTTSAGATMLLHGGQLYIDGSYTSITFGSITTGTIIGIAFDVPNKLIWYRTTPTGNWNTNVSANPAAGIGGASFSTIAAPIFVVALTDLPNDTATANFGATAFSGAVPSGFTAGWGASSLRH